MKAKHPLHIMAFDVVISNGDVMLEGDFEVVWGLWLKPIAISLNKFNFIKFLCSFDRYIC